MEWILVDYDDCTMSWSANKKAPDLELSITSISASELMSVNVDKGDGSIDGIQVLKGLCVSRRGVHRFHTYRSWARRIEQD